MPRTIPERSERVRPKPLEINLLAELVKVPFESVAAKVDLVVEGRVQKLRTYLSDDQCDL